MAIPEFNNSGCNANKRSAFQAPQEWPRTNICLGGKPLLARLFNKATFSSNLFSKLESLSKQFHYPSVQARPPFFQAQPYPSSPLAFHSSQFIQDIVVFPFMICPDKSAKIDRLPPWHLLLLFFHPHPPWL